MAAYVKQHNFIKELRIVEKIFDGHKGKKMLDSQIQKWGKLHGVHFISSHPGKSRSLLKFNAKLGPVLTIKALDIDEDDFSTFLNLDNWAYSLGDLELF